MPPVTNLDHLQDAKIGNAAAGAPNRGQKTSPMSGSHISLFAGVGMTDIAVEDAGFRTIATAEIDPFCQRVLRRRFPHAHHFDDVRHVTPACPYFRDSLSMFRPLLISGGFPCQDVAAPSSTQTGINGARTGLWTEFARIIREFKPDFVLIENSPMLRSRGLKRVLDDLCERGYSARWDCIPATSVGAPHRRDRIWIVAWPNGTTGMPLGVFAPPVLPRAGTCLHNVVHPDEPRHTVKDSRKYVTLGRTFPTITLSDGTGGPGTTPRRAGGKNLRTVINDLEGNGRINPRWGEWLMGLPLGWTDPGVPNHGLIRHLGWDFEPANVPRTLNHRAEDRARRIKALGNGLVPQVARLALSELSPEGSIT